MQQAADGLYRRGLAEVQNGPMPATTAPPRDQARQALASSVAVQRNILLSALRWSCAAVAFTITTAAIVGTAPERDDCAGTRSLLLLQVWVCGVTARIVLGTLFRFIMWRLWDVTALSDRQPQIVYIVVRLEFMLLLVSVLWTTIAFMYTWGSSGPCATCTVRWHVRAVFEG